MSAKYEFVPGDTHLEYRLLIEIAHSRITRARAKLGAYQ